MIVIRTSFIFLIACVLHPAMANDEWLPSYKQIENIEKNISLPKNASQLTKYSRYYTGQLIKSEQFIVGRFILKCKNKGGIQIVPQNELPKTLDGGCGVINFKYSTKDKQVVSIFCNGEA